MNGLIKKIRAFAPAKAATVYGWQLEYEEKDGQAEVIQVHYLVVKLTGKQVKVLNKMPLLSLKNLLEPGSDYRYVIATNLHLMDDNRHEKKIKVARKEWKNDPMVTPYLTE